jgi:hypothetical protein
MTTPETLSYKEPKLLELLFWNKWHMISLLYGGKKNIIYPNTKWAGYWA